MFQEICQIKLKVRKKRGSTLSLEDIFLEKPQGGSQSDPSAFYELKQTERT